MVDVVLARGGEPTAPKGSGKMLAECQGLVEKLLTSILRRHIVSDEHSCRAKDGICCMNFVDLGIRKTYVVGRKYSAFTSDPRMTLANCTTRYNRYLPYLPFLCWHIMRYLSISNVPEFREPI